MTCVASIYANIYTYIHLETTRRFEEDELERDTQTGRSFARKRRVPSRDLADVSRSATCRTWVESERASERTPPEKPIKSICIFEGRFQFKKFTVAN